MDLLWGLYGLGSTLLFFVAIGSSSSRDSSDSWLFFFAFLILGYIAIKIIEEIINYVNYRINYDNYRRLELELNDKILQHTRKMEEERKQAEENKNALIVMKKEISKGIPFLARAYDEYFNLQDKKQEDSLRYKSHPAPKAADRVREINNEKREAERKARMLDYQLAYYEYLFPYLLEYKDIDVEETSIIADSKYTEEELIDPATYYLPAEEYRKLGSAERNDRALKHYWIKNKSKWEIGKMYERYIGYLYEKEDYQVEYKGIIEGFADLGRDLICKKSNSTKIIQCKYWAKEKMIRVAHINQLFGTVTQYRIKHQDESVEALFYTSTQLDDVAKEFANYLHIELKEHFPFDRNYPCIKCNISKRTREKIYHLPFDQQYDRTIIEEEENECYVSSCVEAEKLGFRRAYRWHGDAQKTK